MEGFLSLSSSVAQLPVIYDLNFEEYPKDIKLKNTSIFDINVLEKHPLRVLCVL